MSIPANQPRKPVERPKPSGSSLVKFALRSDVSALRRAAAFDRRTIVRVDGKDVAVIPLSDLRRLEWFLEQEEKEAEDFDQLDIEEAERRLADPNDATIPYEQVRRELGLGELSD